MACASCGCAVGPQSWALGLVLVARAWWRLGDRNRVGAGEAVLQPLVELIIERLFALFRPFTTLVGQFVGALVHHDSVPVVSVLLTLTRVRGPMFRRPGTML